jgi:hypothetical protein
MLHFHTNLFATPTKLTSGPTLQLRGEEFAALVGSDGSPPLFDQPLPLTFEELQEKLLAIPRMDIEPDGYFLVAGGEKEGERWQIDGHLFEYEERMHRVEIHGSCPAEILTQLVACCGADDMVFQLVHEGVTLSHADFRRWASLDPNG